MTATQTLDPGSVLFKVMTVLQAFDENDRVVGLAELRRRTGLPKTTLHRMCGDLVSAQLLERGSDGYQLSRRLFELGLRASVERRLVEIATPYMEDLYELTHETIHLGVRQGAEVLYVAKIGGHRQAKAPSRIGGRLPLHVTAIGKVLLAHGPDQLIEDYLARPLGRHAPRSIHSPSVLQRQLDQIRADGVGYEFEESAVGIVCVSAPIFDDQKEVEAAISVAGLATRFMPQRTAHRVRAVAEQISSALAADHRGEPPTREQHRIGRSSGTGPLTGTMR